MWDTRQRIAAVTTPNDVERVFVECLLAWLSPKRALVGPTPASVTSVGVQQRRSSSSVLVTLDKECFTDCSINYPR